MKHLLSILLLAALCATTGFGQTIKTLGFNTTNGQVVANTGTNTLTFTNDVKFGDGDLTVSGQNISGGVSLSFEDGSYVGTLYMDGGSIQFSGADNAATTRTNLSLGATWLTNTNVTNFRTAIGLGATNDVTFSRITAGFLQSTTTNASIELDDDNFIIEAALLEIRTPITFDNSTNASVTRTNLGLGLPALTNTSNVTMMRELAGSTNTGHPFSGTFNVIDDNSTPYALVVSNGIIVSVTEY
jgi:hypothetical protein